MNPRHRDTARLTLGFLTLGAQAAPLETIEAAAQAGYGAAGPRISGRYPGDAWPAVDGVPGALGQVRERARSLGVRISSVSGYYISPQVQPSHLQANIDAARAVGAPMILQGCFEDDHARVASLLRGYAEAAADAGLRIALEFMPMSGLKSLRQTLALIDASGAPGNVGVLVDTLHLVRSGATAADVAALDPSRIYLTQLSDAPAALPPGGTLFHEAMSGRMYLGDGQLDLASVVRALPPEAELELETPVVADAHLPPVERARKAAEAARRFFEHSFSS